MASPLSPPPSSISAPPIPAPKGLEHLRIMERAASYTNLAVSALHEQYGDIFAFGFGNIRFIWLVGADAAQLLFQREAANFRNHDAYGFLQPIGGDYALITSDEPLHLRLRRVVQPAFRHSSLEAIIQQHLARLEHLSSQQQWQSGNTVDLYHDIRPVILASICQWLLGEATLRRYPHLLQDIRAMMDFANLPFLAQQFKWNLPLSPWRRFLKARRRADAAIYAEIARRKQENITGDDVLARLLEARLEDGSPLPEQWLRDQAISLVSAGFDTSSAGLAWLLYHLLEHPQHRQIIAREIPNAISFSNLNAMQHLELCLKESLRLFPPAPAALRHAAADIDFQGYTIPKGSLVALSIYVTQRRADYFPEPLAFQPERWRDSSITPFSYIPFGQGQRYCIGAGLAQLLIKTSAIFLLQRYRFRPAYGRIIDRGNTVAPVALHQDKTQHKKKNTKQGKIIGGLPVTIL